MLMSTLEAFENYDPGMKIILVLPSDQIEEWRELCHKYSYEDPSTVVRGGETRFRSVKNGLHVIDESGLVAVHDGVRPLVTAELIESCFQVAETEGNAVPCISIPESVREIDGKKNRGTDRSKLMLIQTPQVFQTELLKDAFKQPWLKSFTDEATMIENMGIPVRLIKGDPTNIKITCKTDLIIAEALLSEYNS